MKEEESVANINMKGKQSVCLELKKDIDDFLLMLLEKNLVNDTSDESILTQVLGDGLMILAGLCCEGDYIVTTDEDEEHDEKAFTDNIRDHGIAYVEDPEFEQIIHKVWMLVKPFTTKRLVTWG